MRILLITLVVLIEASQTYAEKTLRTWTSTSGKTVEATFEAIKNGKVLLKNADGWAMSVPITSLSQADQHYIEKQTNPSTPNPAETPESDTKETRKSKPTKTNSDNEASDDEAVASTAAAEKKRTYKLGEETVKGYLSYRFKNGTTAIVFPHHRYAIAFYHPRLGRTYRMTTGGHGGHNYARMVIDDVQVLPPNVRIRYREEGYPFNPEGYSIAERKEMKRIDVLQGELRMTFHPEGFKYTSYAKALVEDAPRHFVHFHGPELTHNLNFRGGAEKLKEVFADSKIELKMSALPKKTMEISVGERVSHAVAALRKKYKVPPKIPGYQYIAFIKRSGVELFSCTSQGETEYLTISTYGGEPMERRSWIGHHTPYDKGRYNYIPHPTKQTEFVRMKKGTIVSLTGEVIIR